MKNIYEDEFFGQESQDIINPAGYEYMQDSVKESPEKPQSDLDLSFGFEKKEEKKVRSARQAPPPIKRPAAAAPTVPPQPYQAQPQPYPYGQLPYGQQPVYPQPVYYQPDPSQPYPPAYYPPQGQPYPTYIQVPYGQPPADYAGYPPVMPQTQIPYGAPYQMPQPVQPAPSAQSEPDENDAGTRVLFQSEDFDKKEESFELHETLPHNYNPYRHDFDVSEVELPSTKRAGTPPKKAAAPTDFSIDEMEIGTYEFSVMTAGRSTKATFVDIPAVADDEPEYNLSLYEEEYEEAPQTEASDEEIKEIAEKIEANSANKSKKPSSTELIRRAVLAVSLVAIVIACYSLFNEYRLHKQNQQVMSNISDLIITETTATTTDPTEVTETTKKQNKTTTKPTTTRALTPAEQWEQLKRENPDLIFPQNMQLKYAKLYAQNPDFVGYLYAEGSELDSPIVQGEDDEEYVEKNFYGEETKYACPFITARNQIETLDTNTVIFGHHMRDGSIFACLDQYRTLDGYKKAPVISFNTIYQDYNFKIIATMVTNINPEDDNNYVFNYFWTNLNSSLNYSAYLNQLSQRSLYDTGVDVMPTDKLLTLSTCCNDFDNARLVVVARLVRPGESLEVDTSRAVENENPRFPQAYYDEEGTENPFKSAYKWQIS